jgi:anti-sigma factor ChrR (cupin superfamily)
MKSQTEYEECSTAAALYALGALSAEETRQFEQRLASGCPLCAAEFSRFAEVADQLADSAAQQPPPSLREKILGQITAGQNVPQKPSSNMTLVRQRDSKWQPTPLPGVQVRPLLGQETFLVRMEPGTVYPEHQHARAEQCYVLEGSITDSDGITAYAGDFVCMAPGSTHEPIHTETGCVLFIAYTA